MSVAISALALLRSAFPTAAMVIAIAILGAHALIGSNGVLAWRDYSDRLDARSVTLATLEARKAVLANRVGLLDPRRADPDYADEVTRRELGLAHPDEIIIPLD